MKDVLPELPDDSHEQIAELRSALLTLINGSFERDAKIDKLAEQLKDLQNLQKQTDERLNAVISMIEKFSGNGKNT